MPCYFRQYQLIPTVVNRVRSGIKRMGRLKGVFNGHITARREWTVFPGRRVIDQPRKGIPITNDKAEHQV